MKIKESDWKLFMRLKPVLLNRLCDQILQECAQVIANQDKSAHERYGALFELMERRDQDVAICFDDPRRSNAELKIMALYVRGLLEPDEFAQFSEETRTRVMAWTAP